MKPVTPATITIPGIAGLLERFLRPLAATSGEGLEIRQTERGTFVSAREGRHAATITTRAAGDLEPILVDPAAISQADHRQPVKLYRLTETAGTIVSATGELVDVSIRPGTLPKSATDLADVVAGEVASGMTRAVFEIDPHHLLAVAEALITAGATTATIAAATRWNAVSITAETDALSVAFVVAGDGIPEPEPQAELEADDPLTFVVGGGRRESKRSATGKTPKPREYAPDELPF